MPNVKLWDSSTPPSKNVKTWLDSKKIAQTYKTLSWRKCRLSVSYFISFARQIRPSVGGKHMEFLVINLPNMVL